MKSRKKGTVVFSEEQRAKQNIKKKNNICNLKLLKLQMLYFLFYLLIKYTFALLNVFARPRSHASSAEFASLQ